MKSDVFGQYKVQDIVLGFNLIGDGLRDAYGSKNEKLIINFCTVLDGEGN